MSLYPHIRRRQRPWLWFATILLASLAMVGWLPAKTDEVFGNAFERTRLPLLLPIVHLATLVLALGSGAGAVRWAWSLLVTAFLWRVATFDAVEGLLPDACELGGVMIAAWFAAVVPLETVRRCCGWRLVHPGRDSVASPSRVIDWLKAMAICGVAAALATRPFAGSGVQVRPDTAWLVNNSLLVATISLATTLLIAPCFSRDPSRRWPWALSVGLAVTLLTIAGTIGRFEADALVNLSLAQGFVVLASLLALQRGGMKFRLFPS